MQKTKNTFLEHGFHIAGVAVVIVIALIAVLGFVGYQSIKRNYASAGTTTSGPVIGIAGKCLDNNNNQATNGNKIQLWDCNGTSAQKWGLDSSGAIINANGYCLDVKGGNTSAGTQIQLYWCNGTNAQKWKYNSANKTVVNITSGLCLDTYYGRSTNGTILLTWYCHGGKNQQWTFTSDAAPTPAVQAPSRPMMKGVNLAGAEFGERTLPGTFNKEYTYPSQQEVNYFKSKGMNTIRLPFLWERLQPTANGEFNTDELGRLKQTVETITSAGMTVVIDPHNYGRYYGNIIGSSTVPNAAFANFWERLAGQFKGNSKVVFGLMNEPHDMPTEQWLSAANAAIASIRKTGATNLITVPGNNWTGANSWSTPNQYATNASVMINVSDPVNNFAYEVHQYLDDGSGSSPNCVSATIGVERLAGFTKWLRANNRKAFLGEFGGGNNETCKSAVTGMLQHMQDNKDVWSGWTWWAAGPWWGEYHYTLEPLNGQDRPQMQWLTSYLK